MTPQDPHQSRPAPTLRLTRETVAVAIPAIAAVILGAILVAPSVFASAATNQADSVWAGPVVAVPASTVTAPITPSVTPSGPAAAPIPIFVPDLSSIPDLTSTAPVTTKRAATAAAPKKTTTAPAKTTGAQATAAPPAPPVPTGPFVVSVNLAGGQATIDTCKGPVLYATVFIAEHNGCGGSRFYPLKVGSLVTLTGKAIVPGVYRVTSIAETTQGSTSYVRPHPYALQTCMNATDIRLWYLTPIGTSTPTS